MLLENELVKTKWNGNNIKYYTEKGYLFTRNNDEFEVKVKDLIKGSKTMIPIKCDFCNQIFYKNYNSYNNKYYNHKYDACDKCKTIKSHITHHDNSVDKIWDKLNDICNREQYTLLTTKEEFTTKQMSIDIMCPYHGRQSIILGNLLNGHRCYKCGREKTQSKQKMSKEKIIEIIESQNNNKLLNPDDYINVNTINLNVLCGRCNKETFLTSIRNYRAESTTCMCSRCSSKMSKYEYIIKDFLDSNNIEYIQEKTFDGLRDKQLLQFDFYLLTRNSCIEFDGEQHDNPNYYISLKVDDPIGLFNRQKKHDEMKTQYCIDNNIELIRISYKEQKHIKEILTEKLKLIK